jgi:pilus assembly protein Flp/PilA
VIKNGFCIRDLVGRQTMFEKLLNDKNGATAVEYGLISAIMAVALLSGFGAFSNALNTQFMYLANIINY